MIYLYKKGFILKEKEKRTSIHKLPIPRISFICTKENWNVIVKEG